MLISESEFTASRKFLSIRYKQSFCIISGCGKSSFAYLIANNEVLANPPYTVGCSVEVKLHEYKEDTSAQKTYFIEFFDIGGSLSHQNSRGVFYQQANGIILCHDATNRKSHENLKLWLMEILNKESGKETIKSSYAEQDLDSETFLGSCQVSNPSIHLLRHLAFKR